MFRNFAELCIVPFPMPITKSYLGPNMTDCQASGANDVPSFLKSPYHFADQIPVLAGNIHTFAGKHNIATDNHLEHRLENVS